jgi:formylglycine-generating enzyme required for sulfatase activity
MDIIEKVEHYINEKDGSVLILIPEGEFLVGDKRFVVKLLAYYLGKYTVTNAQYKKFVDETGYRASSCQINPVWNGNSFPPEKADHPVVCVS